MDIVIVAVFAIYADILRAMRHQDDNRAQMSYAEVMTTAIVATLYFSGNLGILKVFSRKWGPSPRCCAKAASLEKEFHLLD